MRLEQAKVCANEKASESARARARERKRERESERERERERHTERERERVEASTVSWFRTPFIIRFNLQTIRPFISVAAVAFCMAS